MRTKRIAIALTLGVSGWIGVVHAQEGEKPAPEPKSDLASIPGVIWVDGPAKGELGTQATLDVPAEWKFSGPAGASKLLQMMENPVSGREQGIVFPPQATGSWFAVFEFAPVGYVEDTDRDELDADAMLESIQAGNEAGNEERKRRGWTTMEIVGWETPPHYDVATKNLEWAVRGKSADQFIVNHNVRLLGREGVMEVTLVSGPDELAAALPPFRSLVATHQFVSGRGYAEYRSGDKIAEYRLAGLVTGGALAIAAKTGILQKFWKLFAVGFVALVAGVKKFFGVKPKPVVKRRPV